MPAASAAGVLARDDARRLAVARDLGDRAGIRRDAGDAARTSPAAAPAARLRSRTTAARRRRAPRASGATSSCCPAKITRSRKPERVDLRLERRALRSVADDREPRVAMREPRQRIDQEAVALPAAQRGDDADQRRRRRQAERGARRARGRGAKRVRVDAGRNRIDARRVEAVVADRAARAARRRW